MNLSVYELTVPQFMLMLTNLKNILNKAQAYADAKKIDSKVLLATRLAPDMFPLSRQIQIASDNAKACVARLAGVTAPVFEDKEQTLPELIERLNKTIHFVETIKPEQFNGYEEKRAEFPWYPGQYLMGKDYLVQHALPNFYFHATAAYAILRANGVELGKNDYLGQQNWKNK